MTLRANLYSLYALLLLGIGPPPATGAELSTADGLALTVDDHGAVTGLRIDGKPAPLRGPGGFYLADVAGVPAMEAERLGNPSFETVAGGLPDGWRVGADWTVDETVAHTGRRSMRVTVAGPEPRSSGALAVELDVQPNQPYRVAMWLRTAGCAPAYYIVQLDANGAPDADYPQICISHANRDADWFQLSHDLVTAPFCRRLRVYVNLWQQTGTAWVDDVSVVCLHDDYLTPQRRIGGRTEPQPDGLRQSVTPDDDGLAFEAVWRAAPDHLEITGEVRDITGRDRAVTVSFRLPIDAAGWTWYDDLHRHQTVDPDVGYGAARVIGERRTIALYPFAALGSPTAALALAVPLDLPRVFRIGCDQRHGYYLNYEFGLAADAAKNPSRASFRFVLYRIDPAWGFRAAAQRYYALFPEHFTVRLDRPGGAGFMLDERAWDDPRLFPAAVSIWDYHKRSAQALHQREETKLFQYTEFAGWWGWALGITPEQAKVKPSPEEAWAAVEALARGDGPHRDVARCIVNCAPHDREGKPQLHRSYNAEWGGYNYLCVPDPEIQGEGGPLNRVTLTYQREVAQVEAFGLDGMYYDCVFVFAVDNYRREHFRWADHPLVFDHLTKRPVLPMLWSIHECAKAIADDMHRRGKLVIANYSVTNEPTEMFCTPFIDVFGNEMLWTWTNDPKFALQRVFAYRRPVSMSWQEAKLDRPVASLERELKQAQFYGTFYQLSRLDPEVRERWVPLTERLASAGWEPLTYANVAGAPRLRIERFGRVTDGNLHFTVRNDGAEAAQAVLSLDPRALGLPDGTEDNVWLARDSWSFEPLLVERGERWVVRLPLPAGDTAVVRVGDPAELARDQLSHLPHLLRVANAHAKALAAAGVAVTLPDYLSLLAELDAMSEGRRLGSAAQALSEARLDELARAAEQKDAALLSTARRVAECTDLARRRVEAAIACLQPPVRPRS